MIFKIIRFRQFVCLLHSVMAFHFHWHVHGFISALAKLRCGLPSLLHLSQLLRLFRVTQPKVLLINNQWRDLFNLVTTFFSIYCKQIPHGLGVVIVGCCDSFTCATNWNRFEQGCIHCKYSGNIQLFALCWESEYQIGKYAIGRGNGQRRGLSNE